MKFVVLMAAAALYAAAPQPAFAQANAASEIYKARVTTLGFPLKNVVIYDGGYGFLKDGTPFAAFILKGSPGILHIVNVRTREVLHKETLPGDDDGSWSVFVAKDGAVYVGGSAGNLYGWREGEKVRLLGGIQGALYQPAEAPNGDIYVGHWPSGHLLVWRKKAQRLDDLGAVVPGESYVRGLAIAGNLLYLGIGAHPHLVRYDIATGKMTDIPLPKDLAADGTMPGGLTVVRDRLFGNLGGKIFVMDLRTNKFLPSVPESGSDSAVASPEYKGKTYLGVRSGLVEYDLATDTWKPLPYPTPQAGKRDYLWVPMNFGIPHLVSVTWSGGLWAYSPDLKKFDSWMLPLEGQPISVQAMESGPDGDLYMSGYPGGVGARWNIRTNENKNFNVGQAEGMDHLGDTMYFGIYPKASVSAMDTTKDPLKAAKVLDIGEEQDRPFGWANDGKTLYIGTVATYGKLGGALTTFTPSTGEQQVYRNLIPNQSIIRLAYRDGLVYGSTTVWGGLGQAPSEPAARIFAWDPKSRTLLRQATPEFAAFDQPPKAINGLTFGPDGKLWAAWQGTIAVLDPQTLKVERAKVTAPSNWDLTHSWENVDMVWGRDGNLYVALAGQLSAVNPKTLDVTPIQRGGQVVGGVDGNIYFTYASTLYRLEVPAS
jgi:hypothetical protein